MIICAVGLIIFFSLFKNSFEGFFYDMNVRWNYKNVYQEAKIP